MSRRIRSASTGAEAAIDRVAIDRVAIDRVAIDRVAIDRVAIDLTAMAAVAARIDAGLRAHAMPERAAGAKAYLKSPLRFYGTTTPDLRRTVRAALGDGRRSGRPLDGDDVVALAALLWSAPPADPAAGAPAAGAPAADGSATEGPVFERRAAALEVLTAATTTLGPEHLAFLERLLRESQTWALVDGLAPWVVAPLVARHPELWTTIDRWAVDPDPWMRRAALLVLLPGLRRGGGDWDRFCRYAEARLADRVFWVTKALGWILRAVAKRDPDRVTGWLLPRATRAGAVTVREAVKYLPAADREAILAAHRAGRRPLRA